MIDNARTWLAAVGGSAASVAAVIFLTSANAAADPMPVPVPVPTLPTVAQAAPITQMAASPLVAPQAASTPMTAAPVGAAPAIPGVAPVAPPLVPATSGTLTDYFKSHNVTLQPQRAQGFQAFNVTLPMPSGWSQVPDPNVPDAFGVIANRNSSDLYTPNAQVVIYKLVGNFDPKEAITHGFLDAESLPAWQSTDASLADFEGLPSSVIEGTYRQNDMTLNTSRRHVIAASGPDRYLVSLAVTSQATTQGATAAADATDAIVNGFSITATTPGAAPPAPVPLPAPTPAPRLLTP
jgi:probable lipoprotein LpqN